MALVLKSLENYSNIIVFLGGNLWFGINFSWKYSTCHCSLPFFMLTCPFPQLTLYMCPKYPQVLYWMHPPQSMWGWLPKPSVASHPSMIVMSKGSCWPASAMYMFLFNDYDLIFSALYSQKEACGAACHHDSNHIAGGWCEHDGFWGEYICQWYDFSNCESSFKLKCFLELFYVGGKVQPLEIHKPLMCIAYLLMWMFSQSTTVHLHVKINKMSRLLFTHTNSSVKQWWNGLATDQVRNSFFTAKSPA